MTPRFGFIRLTDRLHAPALPSCRRRSNPDAAELVRGKTGRIIGALNALLIVMKGLPLTYGKDMQEDKEPLFDARMRQAAIEGFATATDLADYLVKKGLPFRDAHEVVARVVRTAEQQGCDLADLPLEELRGFSNLIDPDVYGVLTLEGSLAARNHVGGTAPAQVREAIARARKRLDA
jgi:argininosuccinate lyase